MVKMLYYAECFLGIISSLLVEYLFPSASSVKLKYPISDNGHS